MKKFEVFFFKETPLKCLSKKLLSSVFLNFKSIFKNIIKHLFYTLIFKVKKHFKKNNGILVFL